MFTELKRKKLENAFNRSIVRLEDILIDYRDNLLKACDEVAQTKDFDFDMEEFAKEAFLHKLHGIWETSHNMEKLIREAKDIIEEDEDESFI